MRYPVGSRVAVALWCFLGHVFGVVAGDAVYQDALIKNVPHVSQKPDFCGEACVEMVLRKMGHTIDQDQVFSVAGVDPLAGRGCTTPELKRAVEKLGFLPGPVWLRFAASRSARALKKAFGQLHADLLKGVASIVCMRTANGPEATEHFRLIVGYDAKKDVILYHEPDADKDGAYCSMSRKTFFSLWPLKYKKTEWLLIRFRMAAAKIQAPVMQGFSPADYAQHIRQLKAKLPHKGFTIVLEPPFIVIGDETADVVRTRAKKTVRWAVSLLKKDYFAQDPKHIIDIWLFKDKTSYMKNAWILFHDQPDTPFGYSSPRHRALVMNIATGGGTLVHEIVHPFMAANFPNCPAWFNEGMGSLYEQCHEKDGKIQGLTNWRLTGLQQAIRACRLPTFKTLTDTTDHEFYNEDPGTNYAQSRYLLYYLQEKKLLRKYYALFVARQDEDSTGYNCLKQILKVKDMDAFQRMWEKAVLKLRFP